MKLAGSWRGPSASQRDSYNTFCHVVLYQALSTTDPGHANQARSIWASTSSKNNLPSARG